MTDDRNVSAEEMLNAVTCLMEGDPWGFLVGQGHLVLLAINRRRTMSSLIDLWWLPIGCRDVCVALVN
jgi:hypothetical protein